MLEAFFDESERDSSLLCVAGYIFPRAQALKLTKEFSRRFGPYGGFHMKELVHRRKGYKGISPIERDTLLRDAVRLVLARYSYGVAVTVNCREYQAAAPRFIRGFGNAYPFLCHLAMTAAATIVANNEGTRPISYVFEAGNAYEKEARFAVRQVVEVPELKKFYLHHADTFLPKKDAVPLAAADLLAWEVAKFKDETLDAGLRDIRASLFRMFADNPRRYSIAFMEGENWPALWANIGLLVFNKSKRQSMQKSQLSEYENFNEAMGTILKADPKVVKRAMEDEKHANAEKRKSKKLEDDNK